MVKHATVFILFTMLLVKAYTQQRDIQPTPSTKPSKGQLLQIQRKYGMFLHFGINTFVDQEWTDGSVPASTYHPPEIDAEQWIKAAKEAGMKYVILIAKHHDGFCLWDSKYTVYDVASSGNKTNVITTVAKACKKYNIGLGLYYSLWDRKENGNIKDESQDVSYNEYMINQIQELLAIVKKENIPIVEFWFDGGWVKKNTRWNTEQLYTTIKAAQPLCQVGVNWTIGKPDDVDFHPVLPEDQKEGFPMRYFPGDFRLGDPYLPANPDPKIFTHDGKKYYLPWESTVCMSQRWFYNTKDTTYKTVDELFQLYKVATAQNNILILNSPPTREGRLREKDIIILKELKKKIDQEKNL